MERKTCRDCKDAKALSEFHRHKRYKDGHRACCKECSLIRNAKYRTANRAKVRAAKRLYYANHKAEHRVYVSRYCATHRSAVAAYKAADRKTVKGRARNKLVKAVSRGIIIKPSRCSSCDSKCEKRLLHGHHDDYTKPLDVRWLCPKCHGLLSRTE